MPCGQLGQNYISRLNVKSSVKTLDYPLNILSGKNIIVQSARPSSWYTLYTADKGTVVRGSDFVLTTALQNAPDAGDALLAYFDCDGDGVFEQTVALGSMQNSETRLDVPAEARIGKCRMRLRLTANGLTDAEDEVAGQTVDFILNVTDKNSSTPTVKVRPNDPARGKAELTEGTSAGQCHLRLLARRQQCAVGSGILQLHARSRYGTDGLLLAQYRPEHGHRATH